MDKKPQVIDRITNLKHQVAQTDHDSIENIRKMVGIRQNEPQGLTDETNGCPGWGEWSQWAQWFN